ncbi:MAG: hypothetical protein U9N34_04605, partial [Candidatus Cloacimonadota bacterium]|nr:hypothetical protein [Candidatus Cloacimonadota bacterium]
MRKDIFKFDKLIKDSNIDDLKKIIAKSHPADIAEILNSVNSETQFELFGVISYEVASELIADLNDDVLKNILLHLNKQDLVGIIDEMDTDEATDLLNNFDYELTKQLLDTINDNESEGIKELLKYDEESAGGIMQTEIFSVSENDSVAILIETIREHREVVDNAHYVFVVD